MINQIVNPSKIDISKAKILLVDDDQINTSLLSQALELFENVFTVHSGKAAIEFCKKNPPDLVLLDVMMPGLDGYATCKILRSFASMENCPIIFSTSLEKIEDEIKCWEAGGTDFVTKPVSPKTLFMRVQAHIRLKLQSDEHKQQAIFDSLTGLRNRRFFDDYYKQQIHLSRRNKTDLSIVIVDVDYFKNYNDCYGHSQGDLCLKLVSVIVSDLLHRPTDIAIRYGGEEFVLVLPDTDIDGAKFIAKELMSEFEKQAIPHAQSPFEIVTASAGVASLETTQSSKDLFSLADKRLYAAKDAGRNTFC